MFDDDTQQLQLPVLGAFCKFFAVVTIGILLFVLGTPGIAKEARALRGDVPHASQVRSELASLSQTRQNLVDDRERLKLEIDSANEALSQLSDAEQRLAIEIESLRGSARNIAVQSFVSGGPDVDVRYLLDAKKTSDTAWRLHLLDTVLVSPVDDSSSRLYELMLRVDHELMALLENIDSLEFDVQAVDGRIADVDRAEKVAQKLLNLAIAWDRADRAIAQSDYGIVPSDRWEKLRFCESSHDYQAVSRTGKYRGAYQFDHETWKTVGGQGDPIEASPSEQDARARELYARRGPDPWPVCGSRHLT